jgi:hypothetical protein
MFQPFDGLEDLNDTIIDTIVKEASAKRVKGGLRGPIDGRVAAGRMAGIDRSGKGDRAKNWFRIRFPS